MDEGRILGELLVDCAGIVVQRVRRAVWWSLGEACGVRAREPQREGQSRFHGCRTVDVLVEFTASPTTQGGQLSRITAFVTAICHRFASAT